jgi:hypothetical protein
MAGHLLSVIIVQERMPIIDREQMMLLLCLDPLELSLEQ